MTNRMLTLAIGALSLLLLAGFGVPRGEAPPTPVQPAKLGFSYLTPEQYKDLWRRADNYAMAEAFLKQCGSPSYVERRMWVAAKDCIEPPALARVAAYFRKKLAEFSKQKFVCDTAQSKSIVKRTRARIDSDVAEVRSMCQACLIC